jgi:hypothetical protein
MPGQLKQVVNLTANILKMSAFVAVVAVNLPLCSAAFASMLSFLKSSPPSATHTAGQITN